MHRIEKAEALPDYKLRVVFSDGLSGEVDLSDMVGKGVFETWNDPEQFAKVFIDQETHTVAWPGGIDLCPDSLYQEIVERQRAA